MPGRIARDAIQEIIDLILVFSSRFLYRLSPAGEMILDLCPTGRPFASPAVRCTREGGRGLLPLSASGVGSMFRSVLLPALRKALLYI